MELLKEINDADIGIENPKHQISYFIRKASRIVLFNDTGEIALLNVTKDKYHKLPGGGIEEGEDIKEALFREVIEEVGARISVFGEVGMIIEYRSEFKLLQISYCYYGKVTGEINNPQFTNEEIEDGFELQWMDIESAINIMNTDTPQNYMGKFVQERDMCFTSKAKELIDKTIDR